jgi:hypothetical protein
MRSDAVNERLVRRVASFRRSWIMSPLCRWNGEVAYRFRGEAVMDRPKRWYNPDSAFSVQVVTRADDGVWNTSRWRHPRTAPSLGECLAYPLKDGSGLGLLIFLPPILWVFSLPIYDVISYLQPMTKGNWALGLMVVPIMLPMIFSFLMTFGYALLFLGHVLVSSALGELDHPRWPEWHPSDISEGIVRWFWAGLFGLAVGGGPIYLYWTYCGDIDWFDWLMFAELTAIAAGYSLMAMAAALLHENIAAANPITVISAIMRIGWGYLRPCLVAGVAVAIVGVAGWILLFEIPTMWTEGVALWAFWVLIFYVSMVVIRMMGLTYHAHALDLHWFRRRPGWASSRGKGQIYANS